MQTLRTATPMGDWRSFRFTVSSPGGIETGDLLMVQNTAGVVIIGEPIVDANGCAAIENQHLDAGDEGVLIYHAEKIIVCKQQGSGQAALPGDRVYWSGIQEECVTPVYASGLFWIGIFTEPAAADDATAEIDLKGDKASLNL
jgi:hypothetical protein